MTHTANTEVLCNVYFPLFQNVLVASATDELRWRHRVATFAKCGLLDFATPSLIKARPVLDTFFENENGERVYAFTESDVERPTWRRRLVRKLQAARPSKYARHRLELDRNRIQDATYVSDIAKVLTYKWVSSMEADHLDMLAMKLIDEAALEYCLDRLALNEVSAERVTGYLLNRAVNELLDKNEDFQNLMNSMKTELAVIREEFAARVKAIADEVRAESDIALDLILREIQARCDAYIVEINERAAKSKADQERFAAENCHVEEDPQTAFRRAVDEGLMRRRTAQKRLARRRRRHPLGFTLWLAKYAVIAGGIGLLAFNLEVNGTTLPELIESLMNYFGFAENEQILLGNTDHADDNDYVNDEELAAA